MDSGDDFHSLIKKQRGVWGRYFASDYGYLEYGLERLETRNTIYSSDERMMLAQGIDTYNPLFPANQIAV